MSNINHGAYGRVGCKPKPFRFTAYALNHHHIAFGVRKELALWSTYHVTCSLQMPSHLILIATLQERYYCHLKGSKNLRKVNNLMQDPPWF